MILRLLLCFVGVFVSFLLNGYAVESITLFFGEQIFKFYMFMVLAPSLFTCIYAKGVLLLKGCVTEPKQHSTVLYVEKDSSVPNKFYFLCSVFFMCSMLCANASLAYINYPTQLVLKSSKPVSILGFGMLFNKKHPYKWHRMISIFVVVAGVMSFMYQQHILENTSVKGTMTRKLKFYSSRNKHVYGWCLVFLSLCFDGLLATTQVRMRQKYILDSNVMMYCINFYSSILLSIGVLAFNELPGFMKFLVQNPTVPLYLLILGITGAVGQSFIYLTVTSFGPLTCSVITTTRKFFNVFLSVAIFSHLMSLEMWLSVLLVFVGLSLDIWSQKLES